MDHTTPDEMFDTEDVARRFKVQPHTVACWRHRGVGPRFVRVGGTVRYRPKDIAEYEHENLCESTRDARRAN